MAVLALLWGGNSVGLKIGLESLPPITLSTLRFALGWLLVGGWALLRGHSLSVPRSELGWIAAFAALFVVQTIALTVGTHHTSAAHSTIIMSAFPFFTALLAHLLVPGDRLTPPVVIGIAVAFGGVAVTFIGRDIATGATALGDLVLLGSSIGLALRTVCAKRFSGRVDALQLLFWMMTLSLPPYAVLALIFEEPFVSPLSARSAVALGYVGAGGGRLLLPVVVLDAASLQPEQAVGAVLPAAAGRPCRQPASWSASRWGPALIAGGALVAVGIAVVNRPPRTPTAPASASGS